MPLSVLVVVSPRKGCEARCRELGNQISGGVKDKEPDTQAYTFFSEEADGEQETDFYFYFEVTNEEHIKERTKLAHHQEVRRALAEEDLLRKPLRYIRANKDFSWRR